MISYTNAHLTSQVDETADPLVLECRRPDRPAGELLRLEPGQGEGVGRG